LSIIIAIYGLLIGSFLNVCIYRIPNGESIIKPPSHCTSCGKRIKLYDLIPIVSYMILRGKCRYCGSKISVRYFFIEFLNAVIYILIYFRYGLSFEFFKYCILASFMIVIAVIDYKTTDVYSSITYAGLGVGCIFLIFGKIFLNAEILTYIYGIVLSILITGLIIILTKGMGTGDIEIYAIGALFMGFKLTILMFFVSIILGGVIGIILIMMSKKTKKDYIPFGPMICAASMICILFGNEMIQAYLNLYVA
jgi:leader peptidase (prepilin peptidase)/N-methyltransferase